ncbi:MAG: argininosuccinate synthase [Halanaerobiales bacterium]|nr:argininosuccinate synthase [Halanaerobiales bacterium]
MGNIKKILLAYSGGLDTSVSIKWLKERYDAEVITYTANLGQKQNPKEIKDKAIKTGASKAYVENLEKEFVNEYVFKGFKANALYENKYPLATALGRPLITKKMVEIAQNEEVSAIAHGCTGKGNDQVRFEVGFKSLAPKLKVIAPLRDWEFKSREEEIEYALKNNISVSVKKDSPYSIDQNLWGVSIECGVLEDPWEEPPEDAYLWTRSFKNTPEEEFKLEIFFENGIPISINGITMNKVNLIKKLNKIGGKYGIGRIDLVENRLVGIKSHEIYEAPAAEILMKAHTAIEELTLDKESKQFKHYVSSKYAELIYNGLWFSPLRKALDSFIDKTQKVVSGQVKLVLYKGNCRVIGRKSSSSLYHYGLATYDKNDIFDHKSASGFINLWALPIQIANAKKNELRADKEVFK